MTEVRAQLESIGGPVVIFSKPLGLAALYTAAGSSDNKVDRGAPVTRPSHVIVGEFNARVPHFRDTAPI